MTLRHFNGKQSPVTWWAQFIAYITLQRMSNEDAIMTLPFYLYDAAVRITSKIFYEKAAFDDKTLDPPDFPDVTGASG